MSRLLRIIITLGVFFLLTCPAWCASSTINLDFFLPAPEKEIHQHYLGLEKGEMFSIEQIQAQVIIVEIYSMYCPICQREAGNVNRLYKYIQNNDRYRDKVKLIGIGAGNSDFEVTFFKKNYNIEFPLFSDRDFVIHKKVGEPGTPFFIGLKRNKDGKLEIFFTQSGKIKNPETFPEELLKDSGITP